MQLLEQDLHRCLHACHYSTAHRLKIHMFCSYRACSKMFYKIKLTTKFYKLSNCLLSSVVMRVLSFLILALFSVIIIWMGLRSDDKMTASLEDKVKHC